MLHSRTYRLILTKTGKLFVNGTDFEEIFDLVGQNDDDSDSGDAR